VWSSPTESAPVPPITSSPEPNSFVSGRYQVKKLLGEGGMKKVYLVYDTQLDRDVAFSLIKTEGLDDTSRIRVTREAQAMGRLGTHSNIVTIHDIGDYDIKEFREMKMQPSLERALRHKEILGA